MRITYGASAILTLIILINLTACQTTTVLSSAVELNTPTLRPTLILPGGRDLREIPASASPLPPTATSPPPTAIALSATPLTPTATRIPGAFTIGTSVAGREIVGLAFGRGTRSLLLVGGIHGGWEGNTVTLMHELSAHFAANPADIPAGLRLVIVPVANPDGLPLGRVEAGRFNANGVDLNRNWGCGWSADARWRDQTVNPGPEPLSEPETRALAAFIQDQQPGAVLFYHSAAGGVFAGSCDGDHGAQRLAQIVGEAAGYSYGQPFSAYPVTGTAPSWVVGLGIPAADVELLSWTESEFDRNLRAVLAVLAWLAA